MSSEVGAGHFSIFPTMPGFRSAVVKEARGAGVAGAKGVEGGFKGVGRRTGRTLGRDMKQSLTTSAGDLGAAALGKLNGKVASASAALSKARLRQQDEAGRVRVAETRLREAVEKSGEGSSQAVAAEERLESARRKQQTAIDAVTAATSRLRAAQDAAAEAARQITTQTTASAGGLRLMAQNLHAGWTDARAATSAFTGMAGSIGGVLRAVSDVSGLSALGRLRRRSRRWRRWSAAASRRLGVVPGRGWAASAPQSGALSPRWRSTCPRPRRSRSPRSVVSARR
jgi:hypothetical protein